jgi:hypothetical protein
MIFPTPYIYTTDTLLLHHSPSFIIIAEPTTAWLIVSREVGAIWWWNDTSSQFGRKRFVGREARVLRNMAGINEFVHEKKGNAFSSSFWLGENLIRTFPPRPFSALNGEKKERMQKFRGWDFYLLFRERFVRLCTICICMCCLSFIQRGRHITEAKQVTCEIKLHGTHYNYNNNNSRLNI